MTAVTTDIYVPAVKWNIIAAIKCDGTLNACFGFPNDIGLGNGFGQDTFEWWFAMILLPVVVEQVGQGAFIVCDNASVSSHPLSPFVIPTHGCICTAMIHKRN